MIWIHTIRYDIIRSCNPTEKGRAGLRDHKADVDATSRSDHHDPSVQQGPALRGWPAPFSGRQRCLPSVDCGARWSMGQQITGRPSGLTLVAGPARQAHARDKPQERGRVIRLGSVHRCTPEWVDLYR